MSRNLWPDEPWLQKRESWSADDLAREGVLECRPGFSLKMLAKSARQGRLTPRGYFAPLPRRAGYAEIIPLRPNNRYRSPGIFSSVS